MKKLLNEWRSYLAEQDKKPSPDPTDHANVAIGYVEDLLKDKKGSDIYWKMMKPRIELATYRSTGKYPKHKLAIRVLKDVLDFYYNEPKAWEYLLKIGKRVRMQGTKSG